MKLETNASDDGWDVWMVIEEAVPDTDGTYFVGTVEEDYAKEIVKRVNLHDELVEALDLISGGLENAVEDNPPMKRFWNKGIADAKALLERARNG
jgi:hypothetical protein